MSNYKATPGQWIDIEFCDKDDFRSAGIKELRSRIEQLEAQANRIPEAIHCAIEAMPPVADPAPVAGGLVARVIYAICGTNDTGIDWSPEARAAILEVARWMRDRGWVDMPDALEQEVGR